MILLDTNVVSEAIKPDSHPSVRAWLDAQVSETLFLPSVTVAELLFGIGALPEGRRRTLLAVRIDGLLDAFAGRILPFDTLAAQAYADLAVRATVYTHCKRPAKRIERLLATGTGSDASPATMSFEGQISPADIQSAMGN